MLSRTFRSRLRALLPWARRVAPEARRPEVDGAKPDRPKLLGLDLHPTFDKLYEVGPSDEERERLASMRPHVLEVFLRVTVDRQTVPEIALELGLSRRTVRRLLLEAVKIASAPQA
jgi:DNA-directed RNA polymerase specialized sigma24 family protein